MIHNCCTAYSVVLFYIHMMLLLSIFTQTMSYRRVSRRCIMQMSMKKIHQPLLSIKPLKIPIVSTKDDDDDVIVTKKDNDDDMMKNRGFSSIYSTSVADTKDRPYTLPPGLFRPKQSLGQNYLSDQNYVLKICDAFSDSSEEGMRAVEIGPGMGALTRVLFKRYPRMTAIEIDQRSVAFLNEKMPQLDVKLCDALDFDFSQLAADKGGKLNIIGNLPYHITSQILFTLADNYKAVNKAVVTMQLEVAERICAQPSTKQYGIPSVIFQLYGSTKMNFKIPPTVFFPVPKVDSALVTIDFTTPHRDLHLIEMDHLRKIVTVAFRQRRKMMRQSLKDLLLSEALVLPARWATKRPEELRPEEFIQLTIDVYGSKKDEHRRNTTMMISKHDADINQGDTADALPPVDASPIVLGKNRLLSRLGRIRRGVTEMEDTSNNSSSSLNQQEHRDNAVESPSTTPRIDKSAYISESVWRKALFG